VKFSQTFINENRNVGNTWRSLKREICKMFSKVMVLPVSLFI
jgi:hypothetical protein